MTGQDDVLFGGAGDDFLHGGGGDDQLHGQNGDDQLWGNEDDDTLFGERHADILRGGKHADTLVGGNGADTLLGGEPLRDIVVTQDDIYERSRNWDEGEERYVGRLPTVEDDPFICAITDSNAIRCSGWRYGFSDLQNALPKRYYGTWR